MERPSSLSTSFFSGALLIAALGYFVDVYDLILFSVVRVASLTELGVPKDKMLEVSVSLLNHQMLGMLIGGILWGILADKLGRMKALFGSIIVYSAANIANGFIHSIETYALLRFIAGVGLAGELGAGITLVSELLPKEKRGYGTTIIASVGVAGAVVAGLTGEMVTWRTAYLIGGALGLLLLALRVSVHESGIFQSARESRASRGNFTMFFRSPSRLGRYLACIFLGLPPWFIVGILVTLAPEVTGALGAPEVPKTGLCVLWCYVGLFFGDAASGLLSQFLKSRKKAIGVYLLLSLVMCLSFLTQTKPSLFQLYLFYAILGFAGGYWVLVITIAAEQFGTNIRGTAATTVPNFIRGAVVPMTQFFVALKSGQGVIGSALIVASVVWGLGILSLFKMRETFHVDLDFTE